MFLHVLVGLCAQFSKSGIPIIMLVVVIHMLEQADGSAPWRFADPMSCTKILWSLGGQQIVGVENQFPDVVVAEKFNLLLTEFDIRNPRPKTLVAAIAGDKASIGTKLR